MKKTILLPILLFFSFFSFSQNLFYLSLKIDSLNRETCVPKQLFDGLFDGLSVNNDHFNFCDKKIDSIEQCIKDCINDLDSILNIGDSNLSPFNFNKAHPVYMFSNDDYKQAKNLFNKKESSGAIEVETSRFATLQFEKLLSAKKAYNEEIEAQEAMGVALIDQVPTEVIASSVPLLPSASLLIDGASQFLVERTKEELNMAFVEKFRAAFKNNSYFQQLFPSVSNVVLYNDPLNFSVWGKQLDLASKKDIQDLPMNLSVLIKSNPIFKSMDTESKELLEVFFVASQTAILQKSGVHPVGTLAQINQRFGYDNTTSRKNKINKALSLTQAISESFYINDSSGYVSAKEIIKMTASQKSTFLTLFALKYKDVLLSISAGDDAENLYSLLLDNKDKTTKYHEFFALANQLNTSFNAIAPLIDTLQVSHNKLEKKDAYKELLNHISYFYEIGFKVASLGDQSLYDENGYYLSYKPILTSSIDLSKYLLDQNFAGALVSLNMIVTKSLNFALEEKIKNSSYSEADTIKEIIHKIVYWGGFMTELASIDSTYKVKDLLKKYAQPVGSYRIKRQSRFSVTLNAYPGLHLGGEKSSPVSLNKVFEFKEYETSFGVTAPIGISFNWASRDKIETKYFDFLNHKEQPKAFSGSVWGMFVPIVDIGAPFVYRWSNDASKGFPDELKWEQIFAPGFYVSYGFKNSGFTMMVGGQAVPLLRTVTENSIDLGQKDIFRAGMTLTYDIPVFTLYRKKN